MSATIIHTIKFPPGRVVATQGAHQALPVPAMVKLIARHLNGDWGDVCDEDAKSNDRALIDGTRLLSAYPIDESKPCKGWGDNCIWIITEADRSVTTILLPEEY